MRYLHHSLLFLVCFAANQILAFVKPKTITIRAKKAIAYKSPDKTSSYIAHYKGDVSITLDSTTTITGDVLSITGSPSQPNKKEQDAPLKKIFKIITIEGNVCIKRTNYTAKAARAEFIVDDNICHIMGNVEIIQHKQKEKDTPITVQGSRATLDLSNEKFSLIGSPEEPVQTVIHLK